MTAPLPVVIIGAGMAAYGVAREFRKLDKTTPLVMVSGDGGGSYAKPMLSNAFALGKGAAQLVSQSAEQMAATLAAQVLTRTEVVAIDSAARTIETSQGEFIGYSQLVLALGALPIRLPIEGDGAGEILSVNHVEDYAVMRDKIAALGRPARVAILGAGLIGCEFADDLVAGGHAVTLIDPNQRPLAALAAPALSDALAQAWAALPITLKLGTTAASVQRGEAGLVVSLADGSSVEADVVLSAVGLRPSIALAKSAQLETRRGIVIDGFGQTSAPGIYALGDCAEYSTAAGGAVLPYIAPLLTAARAIGATLAGTPTPIELKADAVLVKTPSLKLALAPPPVGSSGEWVSADDGERTISRFLDAQGVVRGFGLSL
ncbi:MAG: FAD-dependent oxidoreductase, partial [Pseudomonadota bacterium]|nr:FAD-dependent oxidoreductase [Pseudomonadota bacterium]